MARCAQNGRLGTVEHPRRIAGRDWRDGRDERGIQSVHVEPFSHVSRFTRFTRYGLEQIADQLDRLFGRDGGINEMRREIFEQTHSSLVGPQQNHGFLCLQRQRNF